MGELVLDKVLSDTGSWNDAHEDALSPRVFLVKVAEKQMVNNTFLVVDPASHQAVLIDPAWQIDHYHAALENSQSTLSGILLTHSHFDHINLARPLADYYNCPIWMSRQEIDASGFDARQLIAIGETPWFVGQMKIEPIFTPGHTPGCICYLIGNNLFTGDVLFAEGCGICNGLEAAYQMYDSLQLLKARLPRHTHIYPGHTYVRPPGQRFSDVLNHNMYLHFDDRQSFAAYRLRKGQTAQSLMNFR